MLSLSTIPNFELLPDHYQKPDLFLFDMDGTLLNTEFIHAQSIESLIKGRMEAKVIMERFKGMSDKAVFAILSQELKLTLGADEVIDKKNQELIKIIDTLSQAEIETVLPKDMKFFFETLKSKGKKLGLVTASESIIAHHLLQKLELHQRFDLIVTYQTTYQSKPNPSPYLFALRHFQKPATECVIMEDSITGLEAAKLAGAKTIKALWFHA